MIRFASPAALATTSSSCGLICARMRAASPRNRAASASASAARAPSDRWLMPSRAISPTLNSVMARTIAAAAPSATFTARTL